MSKNNKKNGWTLRIGGPVLLVLCAAWVVNQWHLRTLQGELDALVKTKIEAYRLQGAEAGRIGASVVIAKPYVLFGSPVGKIAIYMEQHRVPDTPPLIHGYYFFFARQPDSSWRETESAYRAPSECAEEGKLVLDALSETAADPA
ncbi:MAG: hypothetical protein L3K26_08500 [Candidatus Hydrogenedentes bacterium]|nr:hypothetical protein [Candidatus Hydrogenedentota bacterium]